MNEQPQSDVIYRDSVGVVSLRGEVDIVQAHDLRERLVTAIRNEDPASWWTSPTPPTSTASA